MKRTTVFADEADLAILKAAATRRGITEAELLREAIHLIALSERSWAEPFFSRTYVADRADHARHAGEMLDQVWADQAEAYEKTKRERA